MVNCSNNFNHTHCEVGSRYVKFHLVVSVLIHYPVISHTLEAGNNSSDFSDFSLYP